jgi:hypothetical protein
VGKTGHQAIVSSNYRSIAMGLSDLYYQIKTGCGNLEKFRGADLNDLYCHKFEQMAAPLHNTLKQAISFLSQILIRR